MGISRPILFALLSVTWGARAIPAMAETTNCIAITSLPTTITVQGVYCLTQNLSTNMTSGYAIEIQTNSVVIDLNGFKLGGAGAGVGTNTVGIYALNRANITVKNGTIKGFLEGIILENSGTSKGHVVEDIRAEGNTFVGLNVQGTGVIVRNNQIVSTGGSTVFGANASAFGIYLAGNGALVENNYINGVTGQGMGFPTGIWMDLATGLVINNRIIASTYGLDMITGKYRDNMTLGVAVPYFGGTDAGNNN